MNFRDNIHEWIDRYLNGQMDDGERSEFLSLLQTDADFAKTFEVQKIAHEIVVGKALLGLKAQMDKDMSKGLDNIGRSSNFWKYFGFGAAVVTAIVLYLFLTKDKVEQVVIEPKQEITQKEIVSSSDSLTVSVDKINLVKEAPISPEEKHTTLVPKKKSPENICAGEVINFSCQARGACEERNDGAIEIDANTIKAGKGPFTYSLTIDGDFKSEPVISDLKPGRYNLFVKDSKDCVRKLNVKVEVPEINCDNR